MSKPIVEIQNISKSFTQNNPVVNNVSFDIKPNEIFALLGPSGCGKTTTLRLIAGFEYADSGTISIQNKIVEQDRLHTLPQERGIGFVFQDYALFPHMTALENVAFGLKDLPKSKRAVYAEEVLCRTGMEKYKDRTPDELSGGQQQRVALARAIAPKPKLVLMDEPFSGLDAMLRDSTRKEVRAILKKSGMSAILVTHDQEEALSFADRVAVMNNGKIEQIGAPEEVYYFPKTQFVAQFLGRTNLFRAYANGGKEVDTQFGQVRLNTNAEGLVLCSIRPEHLSISRTDTAEECGTIIGREFRGHDITYYVLFRGDRYIVHTDNRDLFELQDKVIMKPLEQAVVLEQKKHYNNIMGLFDFLIYLLIAAICGGIGQSLGGFKIGSGGCMISAGVGFIGAILGKWIAVELDLPRFWTIEIGGSQFPIIWSIIGAAILSGILGAVLKGKKKIL